jgi:SAM-dependent methyltransferase
VSGETRAHYDRLADTYDENWAHSPEFIDWMAGRILERLDLRSGERVVDLGCGTGLYTRYLVEHVDRVVCVDPSVKMLEQLPPGDAFVPVRASAEEIVSGAVPLPPASLPIDSIVVKEAIHHVVDQAAVLRGLAELLAPGGRILVVMLPTRIEYPLFEAALEVFAKHQPDPGDMASALEGAGLEVDLSYESFPLSFARDRYLAMVRSRYMSLLSMFDDAELAEGIAEIVRRHPQDPLEFPDRFAFVLGRRP